MPELRAKAVISTQFNGQYQSKSVYRIQDFDVDSAIDTDADSWQISIGDPQLELVDVLQRDNEVLVDIFAITESEVVALNSGFADQIGIDLDANLVLSGRDISAVATDSQAMPQQWALGRPDEIMRQDANQLKIGSRLQLDVVKPFKHVSRDGSESYWEFWYRLYRKRDKWIWAERDGTLIASALNYREAPAYRFGMPAGRSSSAKYQGWIPIETLSWKKTTTSRVYDVYVFGQRPHKKFFAHAADNTIAHWIKRPTKIIQDPHAKGVQDANAEAWEEIFEGKVGAIEWTLTVSHPGFIILQNHIAQVNVPQIGLTGEFFVVGSRIISGTDTGIVQEIRLRQKFYAVSRKIPPPAPLPGSGQQPGDGGAGIKQQHTSIRWWQCFVDAAVKHDGPWTFKLFLGVLVSICYVETGFKNVRRGGHTEWYNPPSIVNDPRGFRKFQQLFANQKENPLANGEEYAVGPMQLLTRPYKVNADKIFDPGLIDEFVGGRWHPCSNIMAAALALREKLKGYEGARKVDKDTIWQGVKGYYGSNSNSENQKYMEKVKYAYETYPGYKDIIDKIFATAANPPVPADVLGYLDPFRDVSNLQGARIDMGVDYAAGDSDPIYAIGPATIDYVSDSWLGGGPIGQWKVIAYTFTEPPAQGLSVYVAEYIRPTRDWKKGQRVNSSTVIAHFVPGFSFIHTGIETGWAVPGTGDPLSHNDYKGHGHATKLGADFSKFLSILNSRNAGTYDFPDERGRESGSLPSGWPKWVSL